MTVSQNDTIPQTSVKTTEVKKCKHRTAKDRIRLTILPCQCNEDDHSVATNSNDESSLQPRHERRHTRQRKWPYDFSVDD